MNENDIIKVRYVDFLEENKKINRSIINDEKKKARIEGLKEGREEGLQQGIKQGIEQGIEQGIIQTQKNMVLNMYNEGLNLDAISKYSNLSLREIKKIITK